jgi:hypothetical protein
MVNNSTNINKSNNHLSPNESLNNNDQLFHQYQQNQQPPLANWTQNRLWHMALKIQVLAWNRHKNVIGGIVDYYCLSFR